MWHLVGDGNAHKSPRTAFSRRNVVATGKLGGKGTAAVVYRSTMLSGLARISQKTLEIEGTKVKKVLYYNHYGEMGGAEISLLLMVGNMANVDCLLVAPEGALLRAARERGIATISVQSYAARFSKNPIVLLKGVYGTVRSGFALRKVLKQFKPDVVHANSIRAGLISVVATLREATPVVWHVRDRLPMSRMGRIIRGIAKARATRIVAISRAIKDNFSSNVVLAQKTIVISDGIEIPTRSVASIRDVLGIAPNMFVVGVVGQITLWKRQLDAIRAFQKFVSRIPRAKLLVVGEPRFRRENYTYERQLHDIVKTLNLKNNVSFLGHRSDIPNIMASMDVLLVPSDNEPFGRVVIEAMMAGKPVVGTNAGGIPDIIGRQGEAGLLVEVGDYEGMANALTKLFNHPPLRTAMGNRGRERVVQFFNIYSTCETTYTLYDDLLSDKVALSSALSPEPARMERHT